MISWVMALTDGDLKKIALVVEKAITGEAAREVMKDVAYEAVSTFHRKVVAKQIGEIKDEMKGMATKEDLNNLEGRLTVRIDKLGEVVTDTKTNHERRIRKLEDEVSIEPVARLTF